MLNCTSAPDSVTNSNRFPELDQISLRAPSRFVPFRRTGFNFDMMVSENQFLLYFRESATAVQRQTIETNLSTSGIRKIGYNNLSNMVQFEVPPSADLNSIIDRLNREDEVLVATADFEVSPATDPRPNLVSNVQTGHWWIDAIRARQAWDIYTTQPNLIYPAIGIVDTGVENSLGHFRFGQVMKFTRCPRAYLDDAGQVPNYTFRLYANSDPSTCAQYLGAPHGTGVAALAASPGDDNVGGVGVSWRSQIISADIYGYPRRLDGTDARLSLSVVDAAIETTIVAGARVVNVSQGHGDRHAFRAALTNAILFASRHNALVVFGAGNDGFKHDDTWLAEGADPTYVAAFRNNVIVVGATDELNNPACGQDYEDLLCVPGLPLAFRLDFKKLG